MNMQQLLVLSQLDTQLFLSTAGVSQRYWGGDGPQDEQEPQEQQADAQ